MNKISNTIAAIVLAVTVSGMSAASAQDATSSAPANKCSAEMNESMKDMMPGGMEGEMPNTPEMQKLMEACKSKGGTQEASPQPDNG